MADRIETRAWWCYRTKDGKVSGMHETARGLRWCEDRYTSQTHVELIQRPDMVAAVDEWERAVCDCDGAPDGGGPCLLHKQSRPDDTPLRRLRERIA